MELIDGVSLRQLITRDGPASPESALAVLKGSLLGLAAAHAAADHARHGEGSRGPARQRAGVRQ
jgi:hypothetical protein